MRPERCSDMQAGSNQCKPGILHQPAQSPVSPVTFVPLCFGAQRQIRYADRSFWWLARCSFRAVPGRQRSAICRAVSRRDWWSRRQESGGGLFRSIAELFSVIWISSVAITAFSHTRSRSSSVTSFSFFSPSGIQKDSHITR
jgi:hypothetical protein